jgi:osmotically-inducible protein OsmY
MSRPQLWLLLALPLLHGCAALVVGGALAGADLVHDRRGAGTVVADRRLQLTLLDAIDREPELVRGNYRIKIVVYDGTVLLCGQAATAELATRAQRITESVDGVRRVVNEIEITDEPEGFWRRRQDNVLTARIKTALLDITSLPGFDPTRVNVSVAHRTAYLMGRVSHDEAEAVSAVAREVGGVDKVVQVFEYTD